jgi:hypothetical protein
MARQQRGEKTAAIRELIEQNPNMPTSQIVSTLRGRGIRINPNLVYYTKNRMKKRGGGRRGPRPQASHNGVSNAAVLVRNVKELAQQAGGLKELKDLVEILAE